MNLTNIINTIRANGGVSYSLTYGEVPEKGYAVSLNGFEETIPLNLFTDNDLRNYLTLNSTELADNDNFFGAWINGDSVVLDVSTRVQTKRKAFDLARKEKQQAIYNLETKEVIFL